MRDNGPAHGGEAVRDYLATPDLALRALRLPAYSPDFNPDEAIWAWVREEVTANTCLGTKARVQEQVGRCFAGLADRTAEVQSRCRRTLQALAEAVSAPPESHQDPLHSRSHRRFGLGQAEIAAVLRESVWAAALACLTSAPGIGPVTASWLLVSTLNFALCSGPEALTAYAGLAPVPRESGRSVRGRATIGHDGNARLRTVLYMATLSATRCNPAIKAFYQRLRDACKPRAAPPRASCSTRPGRSAARCNASTRSTNKDTRPYPTLRTAPHNASYRESRPHAPIRRVAGTRRAAMVMSPGRATHAGDVTMPTDERSAPGNQMDCSPRQSVLRGLRHTHQTRHVRPSARSLAPTPPRRCPSAAPIWSRHGDTRIRAGAVVGQRRGGVGAVGHASVVGNGK